MQKKKKKKICCAFLLISKSIFFPLWLGCYVRDLPFLNLALGHYSESTNFFFISPGCSVIKWGSTVSVQLKNELAFHATAERHFALPFSVNIGVGRWNAKCQNVASPCTFHHTPTLYRASWCSLDLGCVSLCSRFEQLYMECGSSNAASL